jgi:hypothetical protein
LRERWEIKGDIDENVVDDDEDWRTIRWRRWIW